MSLLERTYSVLLVSASKSFNDSISSILAENGCSPVRLASSISNAKKAIAECAFDFVIINAPLPDEFGTRFAIDVSEQSETVVLEFVRTDVHDETFDKVVRHGVFVLKKPTSIQTVATALNWMCSARERIRRSEKKTLSIEEKMEEIRLVNRAKWLLISELKMSEQEAHRYIEKKAMDRCVTRKEIAKSIIKTYS